ncbi:MAG: hypothetical protein IPG07_00825 [Crocinitomicaceae bacterium]|nr:hypothetical protein [Crocinitomicaceae bacterium]
MKFIFCIAFLFISAQNFAQCNFYGSIKDADNANEIPFAKVVFSPMDSGAAIITVADILEDFTLKIFSLAITPLKSLLLDIIQPPSISIWINLSTMKVFR